MSPASKTSFASSAAATSSAAAATRLMEGKLRPRLITVEFADYATALAAYKSPEYDEVKKLRQHCASVDLVVVEGYDGAQP